MQFRQSEKRGFREPSKPKMKKLDPDAKRPATNKGKRPSTKPRNTSVKKLVSILKTNRGVIGSISTKKKKNKATTKNVQFDRNVTVIDVQSYKKYNTPDDDIESLSCCSRCQIF